MFNFIDHLNFYSCEFLCRYRSQCTAVQRDAPKTDRHNITEILFKVALKHNNPNYSYSDVLYHPNFYIQLQGHIGPV
jgi:hypothetical protein